MYYTTRFIPFYFRIEWYIGKWVLVPLNRKGIEGCIHKVRALIHFNAFECAHSFEYAYSYLIIPLIIVLHVLLHQSYQIVCRLYTH